MVKFSNIFKLWNIGKQEETTKDKKAETPSETNLKIPPVSQVREIEIGNDSSGENIPQKSAEPIKYSDIAQISTPPQSSQNQVETPVFGDIAPAPNGTRNNVVVPSGTPEKPEPLDLSRLREQDGKETSMLYDKLYEVNQHTLNVINNKLPSTYINIKEIIQLIKEVVASIQSNSTLIDLIYRQSEETYLISHQVNVTLISLAIGHGLDYNRTRLEELGLAAFFHDIGMQELLFLVEKKGKLSKSEYELVRNHIKIGIQILQQIPELPVFVIDVCYQHHERISGSGYLGMQEGTIHEYAQIIGLADTFEALTHNRSHRTAKTIQMTLRELTGMADTEFSQKVLKRLIRKIGIYPVGTFVLLNTQEVAEVIKNNENFPLRPVVKIIYTPGDKPSSSLTGQASLGSPVGASKTLDLLANQTFYIIATLTREEALSKAITDKI